MWKVEVIEIRHVACLYSIEADTAEEAKEKAAIGETIDEEELKDHGVMDRHIENDPVASED